MSTERQSVRGRRSARARALAWVLFASLAAPGAAWAQDEAPLTEDETERARSLFAAAEAALATGDLAAAEEAYRASWEIAPRLSTALNLAVVLHEQGKLREALALYEDLADAPDDELPTTRTELEELTARARASLAHLRVRADGPGPIELVVDGRSESVAEGPLDVRLALDPGSHAIEARWPASEGTRSARVDLRPGASSEVVFDPPPPRPPRPASRELTLSPSDAETEVTDRDGGSEWLWVAIGAGALLVIGAVVAAVLVGGSGSAPYEEGPVPRVIALSGPWAP